MKFKDPKFKHEIFVRIDMNIHTSQIFHNLFAINFFCC